jgi:integrase/recombinase XerD
VKWSQKNKCWYVPLNADSYNKVYNILKGKVELDTTALKSYLEKRKQVTATIPALPKKISSKPITITTAWKLSKDNLAALERFIEQLKLKSYSDSAIRT